MRLTNFQSIENIQMLVEESICCSPLQIFCKCPYIVLPRLLQHRIHPQGLDMNVLYTLQNLIRKVSLAGSGFQDPVVTRRWSLDAVYEAIGPE